MKKNILFLIGMALMMQTYAQSTISTSSDYNETSTVSLSWTIGEAIIETISNETNTLTQGFHQSKLEMVTAIEHQPEKEIINKVFDLYPNPTNGNLAIDVKEVYEKMQVRIFNVSGQQIFIQEFENKQLLQLNLSDLTEGIYTIKLNTEKQIVVYQIIKE